MHYISYHRYFTFQSTVAVNLDDYKQDEVQSLIYVTVCHLMKLIILITSFYYTFWRIIKTKKIDDKKKIEWFTRYLDEKIDWMDQIHDEGNKNRFLLYSKCQLSLELCLIIRNTNIFLFDVFGIKS